MRQRNEFLEPTSDHFQIKVTPYSGLGVYAVQNIPEGTPLLRSGCIPISVILREYRREVCCQCFTYERGRNLKIRDGNTNFSFCSQMCLSDWASQTTELERQAWTSVEAFIRTKAGKGSRVAVNNLCERDHDGDIALDDEPQRPGIQEVESAWNQIEDTAHFIRQARKGSRAKPHQRAVNAALNILPDADVLYFLLSGVLCHYRSISFEVEKNLWQSVLALSPDATPYPSAEILRRHTYSYLHLLALAPEPLLESITASICREIAGRDAHNAFGIRSLEDEGSEFFGWGVWPAASYFNHSCAPNVRKRREGRTWWFTASRNVYIGEELFISYLGGEEETLNRQQRNKSLQIWAFECNCTKCTHEIDAMDTT